MIRTTLTGIFAAILVIGLLAACQQAPGAAPGTPPTTTPDPKPDPKPDPEPPATFDPALNGWGDATATTGINWEITVVGSKRDAGTADNQEFTVRITKDDRGYMAALYDR